MSEVLLLEARDIHKGYGSGGSRVQVLHGLDLAVSQGELTAVVGRSGSGKTTLLQILGTLDQPDQGTVLFRGREITGSPDSVLCKHRNRNIGFIFQFHHLLPEFNALENVIMPGLIAGMSRSELEDKGMALLDQVGLAGRRGHRSGELSGGEQQRVALARALIMEPALLLADEPTGNLDSRNGARIFALLQQLSRTRGLAVIMVTHNMDLASQMDRRLTLEDGILSE